MAEIQAREHTKMYMQDWVDELDKFAEIYGKGVLKDAGKVSFSAKQACFIVFLTERLRSIFKKHQKNLVRVNTHTCYV